MSPEGHALPHGGAARRSIIARVAASAPTPPPIRRPTSHAASPFRGAWSSCPVRADCRPST